MKNHPLFNPLLYSAGLHCLLVIAAILYIFIAGRHYKAPVFVVSLVDLQAKGSTVAAEKTDAPDEIKDVAVTPPPTDTPAKKMSKSEERIAALQAKKTIESRRKPLKQVAVSKSKTTSSAGGSQSAGTYENLIQGIIRKNWATSDFQAKNRGLLAIINIRVERNGQITILGWEKKSGSQAYDREAVRALTASSPLPPPAREIEYSFRFSPDN